jgi:uncharacterized membrane protein (UPF0182 family)
MKRVVVVNGENVEMSETLSGALAEAFGEAAAPEPGPGEPGPPEPAPEATVAQLLAEAQAHFEAADEALRSGDLATYQDEIDQAEALIQQAAELSGVQPSPSPLGSPGG